MGCDEFLFEAQLRWVDGHVRAAAGRVEPHAPRHAIAMRRYTFGLFRSKSYLDKLALYVAYIFLCDFKFKLRRRVVAADCYDIHFIFPVRESGDPSKSH